MNNGNYEVGDVVQFVKGHKWEGCFGYIDRVEPKGADDVQYLIGVPVPMQGVAYIYSMKSKNEFIYIGVTKMILNGEGSGED